MARPRIAAAGAAVLVVCWLVAASAEAEPDSRQVAAALPDVITADVYMRAQADHGPGDDDSRSILAAGQYHKTFRSSFSGSSGTESTKAKQDTDLTLDTSGVTPRLLRVETSSEFTASADAGNPPLGSADGYGEGSLQISIQADNFFILIVEGTLTTGHSSVGGCSQAILSINDSLGGVENFPVNSGPDCGENLPGQTAVVEEFQLPAGSSIIDLAADATAESYCDETDCDPASSGSARWNFTFSFCSNSFTDGTDLIVGSAGRDVLCGGLGADEIYGMDGNDLVIGDAGSDIIGGGLGADQIFGEGGSDEIWGEDPEHCTSEDGGDDLDPGPGLDEIHGCGGNDWIYPGSSHGIDAYGGPGTDRLFGGSGPDHFWGGGARDIMGGFGGDDRLFGEGGNDELTGHAGADRLDGGPGTLDACRTGGQAGDRRLNCER